MLEDDFRCSAKFYYGLVGTIASIVALMVICSVSVAADTELYILLPLGNEKLVTFAGIFEGHIIEVRPVEVIAVILDQMHTEKCPDLLLMTPDAFVKLDKEYLMEISQYAVGFSKAGFDYTVVDQKTYSFTRKLEDVLEQELVVCVPKAAKDHYGAVETLLAYFGETPLPAPPPVPNFFWVPTPSFKCRSIREKKKTRFMVIAPEAPDDTIVEYTWDFGDGSTATGDLVSHQFSAPGKYAVTLTAVGRNEQTTKTVEVLPHVEVEMRVAIPAGDKVLEELARSIFKDQAIELWEEYDFSRYFYVSCKAENAPDMVIMTGTCYEKFSWYHLSLSALGGQGEVAADYVKDLSCYWMGTSERSAAELPPPLRQSQEWVRPEDLIDSKGKPSRPLAIYQRAGFIARGMETNLLIWGLAHIDSKAFFCVPQGAKNGFLAFKTLSAHYGVHISRITMSLSNFRMNSGNAEKVAFFVEIGLTDPARTLSGVGFGSGLSFSLKPVTTWSTGQAIPFKSFSTFFLPSDLPYYYDNSDFEKDHGLLFDKLEISYVEVSEGCDQPSLFTFRVHGIEVKDPSLFTRFITEIEKEIPYFYTALSGSPATPFVVGAFFSLAQLYVAHECPKGTCNKYLGATPVVMPRLPTEITQRVFLADGKRHPSEETTLPRPSEGPDFSFWFDVTVE